MSLATVIAYLAIILSGQGDLVLVERDIREVRGEPWMSDAQVVLVESDCFLAIAGADPPTDVVWRTIDSTPFDLMQYRVLYKVRAGGTVPSLPGEAVLETEDLILIRLPEPRPGPVEIQGIGILRPLRPYHEPLHLPPEEQVRGDSALVDEIVGAIREDSIQSYISHMESYGTRYMTSPEYDACADWADTWIESYGVECELQTFYYSGDSMSNVVAEITGTESPGNIYIICGHLDSYCSNPSTAPGADDNASGSAAVLEAVRVMSPYAYNNTVRFVLFAAEEAWMVGSEYYVQQAYLQGDNILGAVNLDMVLYAPYSSDSVFIPYDGQSEELALAAGDMFAEYAPSIHPRITYDPGAPSDQASFWQYGYRAIEVAEASAEEIWSGYNPYYHQPSDLLANYMSSFPYGTDMIRASIGLIANLAEPVGVSGIEPGALNPVRISVFPNPSTGSSISIRAEGDIPYRTAYLIVDLAGRTVASGEMDGSGTEEVSLPSLPGGIYSVVMTGQDSETVKFVLLR